MALNHPRIRPASLIAVASAIWIQVLLLSPKPLEEFQGTLKPIDSHQLTQDEELSLIPNVPKNQIPEYGIESFKYTSIEKGQNLWKIQAQKASLYNSERTVHAREITAHLFISQNEATLVTGREARYSMSQKDLEVYGEVHALFPDGFEVWSDYLRYLPKQRIIEVPHSYSVRGSLQSTHQQQFSFSSQGLHYSMNTAIFQLPKQSKVTLTKQNLDHTQSKTLIESDICLIHQKTKLAQFESYPNRPSDQRFVRISQPGFYAQCRHADLNYGDFKKLIQYLVAYEDVLIKETNLTQKKSRYATCGRADFNTELNQVRLSEFPQVYDNQDTLIGDVIVLNRDTEIIEIDQSNGFREGLTTN